MSRQAHEEEIGMDKEESLSHTRWECKYHVVFIPKMRRKTLYGQLRKHLGGGIAQAGYSERESDRGGASDARSRAHDDLNSAEVRGVAGSGIHSRVRARSTWRGSTERVGATSWDSISGPVDTLCRQWGVMRN